MVTFLAEHRGDCRKCAADPVTGLVRIGFLISRTYERTILSTE